LEKGWGLGDSGEKKGGLSQGGGIQRAGSSPGRKLGEGIFFGRGSLAGGEWESGDSAEETVLSGGVLKILTEEISRRLSEK